MHAANAFVDALLEVVYNILNIYIWILIISAILSWLVAFDVVNPHNKVVRMIGDFSYRITEPALKPIRRIVPIMGGFDLAPLALIFIIYFLQRFIIRLFL